MDLNGRKPRILCLHGFRRSGRNLEKEVERWPEWVRAKLDLVYIDAPFPASAAGISSALEPEEKHFEWFQLSEDFSENRNFDECIAYIEDNMKELGPFDGVQGFSQGGLIAAALPGMQREGVALMEVPKIKFVIIISGAKFGGSQYPAPKLAENAFSIPIQCPSLHFIGDMDFAKANGLELLDSFVDPFVIYHHEGHIVPELDEKGLEVKLSFITKIQTLL